MSETASEPLNPETRRTRVSGYWATYTKRVYGGIVVYSIVMILTLISILAYIFGADAWRQLWPEADIWTTVTPYWLWVGTFLMVTYAIFLSFLMICLRGTMTTFLWIVAILELGFLVLGGIAFWIWELAFNCPSGPAYCWDGTQIPWQTWWAFGAWLAASIMLIIQSVLVGMTIEAEKMRQVTAPTTIVESPADNARFQSELPPPTSLIGTLSQPSVLASTVYNALMQKKHKN